jgi:hypothetical protein
MLAPFGNFLGYDLLAQPRGKAMNLLADERVVTLIMVIVIVWAVRSALR